MGSLYSRQCLWIFTILSLLFIIVTSGCANTPSNNTTIGSSANVKDINNSEPSARTTISGNVSDSDGEFRPAGGVLIMAVPADGSDPIKAVTDNNGHYSLNVTPGVQYRMAGLSYDQYGQYTGIDFRYPDGNLCFDITLSPGETVVLKSVVHQAHPSMHMLMSRDPKTGNPASLAHTPVTIRGHVYLDGKPVIGAVVEALPTPGTYRTSTITADNGAYVLEISSNTQYDLTASYQGLRHKVWPVYRDSADTGIYDINITTMPKSMIAGIAHDNEPWLKRPGAVAIEAVPMYGYNPITATTGNDTSFSLEVAPFVYYNITGKFRSLNGSYYNVGLSYRTGVLLSGFMLRPNETALVNYFTDEYVAEPVMNQTSGATSG